jgi:glycosyltransferase involved in cell wall biosynthesis
MRIAQIPPLFESVPPKLYGGTERVVAWLCDALVDLGHEVTLFSSADADTRARLIPVRDQPLRLDDTALKSDGAAHLWMLHEVRRRVAQFDVLHFHLDFMHFPMFEAHSYKTVTTLHGRLDMKDLEKMYDRWRCFGLTSISEDQRRPLPDANWLATVHHGLPAEQYRFQPWSNQEYLAFLGRTSPEKGLDVAIRLAIKAGMHLKIAAKVDKVDEAYFEATIAPLLNHPLIEFIGEIGDDQKSEFLGNARALLFPINWPEPFGLVMVEAMACGTPVIAFPCGSVPEVMNHATTGFIVNSEAEALRAIRDVEGLDRAQIRAEFEKRFTARHMAQAYVAEYRRLIEACPLERAS